MKNNIDNISIGEELLYFINFDRYYNIEELKELQSELSVCQSDKYASKDKIVYLKNNIDEIEKKLKLLTI